MRFPKKNFIHAERKVLRCLALGEEGNSAKLFVLTVVLLCKLNCFYEEDKTETVCDTKLLFSRLFSWSKVKTHKSKITSGLSVNAK